MNARGNTAEPFSVLMSIYGGDDREFLDISLRSVLCQTVRPAEIVLVIDGPVPNQLRSTVDKWASRCRKVFKIVDLPLNVGLGKALQIGIRTCSYDIVARMDADDISLPNRFERQLQFLTEYPDVALVNSWMAVFDGDPSRTLYVRRVPETHDEIVKLARVRSPINHPTVMYKRSAVLAAGNYPSHRKGQDYPLWVSMLQAGCCMACLPEVLVKHRCDPYLAARRHSLAAYRSQMLTQKELLTKGFITIPRYVANVAVRTAACVLPAHLTRIARTALRM